MLKFTISSQLQLPQLSEVVHILNPIIADKYFDLGIQLGMKIQQLKSIESKQYSHLRCLAETISLWQNNHTGECSWSTLAKAVKRIGGHDKLAQELEAHDMATQNLMENTDDTGYSSKSDSISGDSSGSEVEYFEVVPGCGCSKEKPCSLYTIYIWVDVQTQLAGEMLLLDEDQKPLLEKKFLMKKMILKIMKRAQKIYKSPLGHLLLKLLATSRQAT